MTINVKHTITKSHIEVAIQSLIYDYYQPTKEYKGQIITKSAITEELYNKFRLYGRDFDEQFINDYDFIEDIDSITEFWGSKLYPELYSEEHRKSHNREKQLKKLGIK
jgi:hypothetical protein